LGQLAGAACFILDLYHNQYSHCSCIDVVLHWRPLGKRTLGQRTGSAEAACKYKFNIRCDIYLNYWYIDINELIFMPPGGAPWGREPAPRHIITNTSCQKIVIIKSREI
jgi:hypothetical protein